MFRGQGPYVQFAVSEVRDVGKCADDVYFSFNIVTAWL